MSGLIGKKVGMTSLYDTEGNLLGCTVLEAGPCVVTHVKTIEKDGYNAVQLAYGERGEKNATSAAIGHFKKAGTTPKVKSHEFKEFTEELKLGDKVDTDIFLEGGFVTVTSASKGKGFQGVVKRHGFSGVGEATHGQHDRSRAPGSLGGSSYPARVFKGLRMAGRMGGNKITTENLRVVKIDKERNLMVVHGSIPGPKGGIVIIWK
ncbi:MAG: 50S ribosomal protein L3 [Flavobacteriales bacterium]|jgi:large subunit ribosomal protein L3|nr:50S ribosomal protein L3 [Flavobacteriales bacterium]MBK6892575.1 50S ribosomal protein L3 [Flavobacteriales bacterium]MBK7246711.1 50S ribosomal protein L3 [Flavobacteriales bacterium]MBK9060967.1 50S ribosomal protein L3 [Flavobacteriales bacterium]MBK9598675.1 50S ribosomal protein L3 [Flavobacteriales bacterium]